MTRIDFLQAIKLGKLFLVRHQCLYPIHKSLHSRVLSTMAPSYSEENSELIRSLNRLSSNNKKLVRYSDHSAPAMPEMKIRSWKMNEFKYYDNPSPFPTLARGIFSTQISKDEDIYRIVVRGYDKFFNIGEVPWTTWASLEKYTAPPYTLSLKANGCIIFIAGLTPSKLLITSKHSIKGDVPNTHPDVGERWLHKHLQSVGKTAEDLAAVLWSNNWTAVAELCDDDFEEHVLPYPPEKSGLHLHGINETTKGFNTLPTDVVDKFAKDWGFIETKSTVLNSIAEVRAFTDEVGKTGKWEEEALEGFVVRTQVIEPSSDRDLDKGRPPYPAGSSLFFKVKFDEPYMMYRDWREITKKLLSTNGSLESAKLPKSKMKRRETSIYVEWVKKEIQRDRNQFKEFTRGKGIIATRNRFLEWMASEDGKNPNAKEIVEEKEVEFGKTIIVPIAIPGVGKTTISLGLAHLFGFGHTQSDDINAKKPAPIFLKNVQALLKDHDVVIADKNNHLLQHRDNLRLAVKDTKPPVRFVALNWDLSQPPATIHRICSDRILGRGENHQTLRADTAKKSHEDVIWIFINTRQELAEDEMHESIEMEIEEPIEAAFNRAVEGCVQILGLPKPDQEKIDEALAVSRSYTAAVSKKPDVSKSKKPDEKQKNSNPRYLAILPEIDLYQILDNISSTENAPSEYKTFVDALKWERRITTLPHITIVHTKSIPTQRDLWDRSMNLHLLPDAPLFKFKLGNVVWNDRVMAITVDELAVIEETDGPNKIGSSFVHKIPVEVVNRLHITVGTRDNRILAVEAGGLVEAWRSGNSDTVIRSFPLSDVFGKGRIKGLMS